jgi:hypothetical protein
MADDIMSASLSLLLYLSQLLTQLMAFHETSYEHEGRCDFTFLHFYSMPTIIWIQQPSELHRLQQQKLHLMYYPEIWYSKSTLKNRHIISNFFHEMQNNMAEEQHLHLLSQLMKHWS